MVTSIFVKDIPFIVFLLGILLIIAVDLFLVNLYAYCMNNIIRKPFRYRNDGVVYWLIGINVLVYVLMQFLGRNIITLTVNMSYIDLIMNSRIGISRLFTDGENIKMALMLQEGVSMMPFTVLHGWVWTFLTYMFVHYNFSHILFNMLGLWIFGMHVERQLGSLEFLLYYLLTGALAGIFSFAIYFFTGQYIVALMGASGALFAVQLAFAVCFPTSIIHLWGIIPMRAPVMVLGFTALELFFTLTGGRGNVAHLTHLAGFGFGWVYFHVRFGISPLRRLTGR